MPALQSCRGVTALVTGASSGLGRLLAVRFAREGAKAVALVARRTDLLEDVAREVAAAGAEPLVLACDVAERAAVFAAAERALAKLGAVDVLVCNAGYGRHRRFVDWDLDDIERMVQVNFLGTVYWTKAILPSMVARRRGWVVFMASVAGKLGVPLESVYAASKFAMVGLAEAVSVEVEDDGVHILTVCPGAIRTPFFGPEELANMPPIALRSMIEPGPVIDAVMRGLRQGKREVTVPRSIAVAYLVRVVASGFLRRSTKRLTVDAMPRTPPA